MSPAAALGAKVQFVSPGEQNRLSALHDDPLTTLCPSDKKVQRTLSPTLITTRLGEKLFCPCTPTATSTVCVDVGVGDGVGVAVGVGVGVAPACTMMVPV